jgi:hypothetical protein
MRALFGPGIRSATHCGALPNGRQLVTLLDAGKYITGLPKAEQLLELTHPA